jgi:hypothetical protein
LEKSSIEQMEQLQDGRFRFAIIWKDQQRQIILEARSKEVGMEWIQSLRNERVSTLKDHVHALESETTSQTNRINDLDRQVQHFCMVEKDRDGALEDARNWKAKFERLEEALRLLTQQVRRPPPITTMVDDDKKKHNDDHDSGEEKKDNAFDDGIVTSDAASKGLNKNKTDDSKEATPDTNDEKTQGCALLDVTVDEDHEIDDIFEVPGTYFSSLNNACQQQRESLRLASIEAAVAVDDLQAANEKMEVMEKRMEKAEKHICKLWEENCTIRKSLKQKKREKRVLVREVKALQQFANEVHHQEEEEDAARLQHEEEPPMEDTLIGSDEERLITELEEHVASSIRLHDRFLTTNWEVDRGYQDDFLNASIEMSEADSALEKLQTTLRIESNASASSGRLSPLQLVSLFDDDNQSDAGESDDEETQSVAPSCVSSVGAEMGDADGADSIMSGLPLPSIQSADSSPERPNPVLELDEEDEDDRQPNLCTASTQSLSSKSVITDNWRATTRLVSPLVDVVDTKESSSGVHMVNGELKVYHLTFYSRTIGIQFQKAPPAPTKPKGLLTDALTADLAEQPDCDGKTATELRSIAAISTWAKYNEEKNREVMCPIATPKDAVLVCGFEGFDDSGNYQRPKLGARLVAFDGVSVEIGNWTFDSIRKAIKARGRPLTLSFRNDFLTTVQRTILTKAVSDMENEAPPLRRTIQYRTHHDRPPSTTPSINSAISHESDCFVNGGDNQNDNELDLSASVAGSSTCWQNTFSASSHSRSSHHTLSNFRSLSETGGAASSFRSFSEAGSSSVLSTTFAPLMANLMKGISERKEKFTPDYLHREPESLENTPQHQDFQSNLL